MSGDTSCCRSKIDCPHVGLHESRAPVPEVTVCKASTEASAPPACSISAQTRLCALRKEIPGREIAKCHTEAFLYVMQHSPLSGFASATAIRNSRSKIHCAAASSALQPFRRLSDTCQCLQSPWCTERAVCQSLTPRTEARKLPHIQPFKGRRLKRHWGQARNDCVRNEATRLLCQLVDLPQCRTPVPSPARRPPRTQ